MVKCEDQLCTFCSSQWTKDLHPSEMKEINEMSQNIILQMGSNCKRQMTSNILSVAQHCHLGKAHQTWLCTFHCASENTLLCLKRNGHIRDLLCVVHVCLQSLSIIINTDSTETFRGWREEKKSYGREKKSAGKKRKKDTNAKYRNSVLKCSNFKRLWKINKQDHDIFVFDKLISKRSYKITFACRPLALNSHTSHKVIWYAKSLKLFIWKNCDM